MKACHQPQTHANTNPLAFPLSSTTFSLKTNGTSPRSMPAMTANDQGRHGHGRPRLAASNKEPTGHVEPLFE